MTKISSKRKHAAQNEFFLESPNPSSTSFHPFYTLTNHNAYDSLYNNVKILLSNDVVENHNMEAFLSYLQALQFRYRREIPHVLSSMYHLLIVLFEERRCQKQKDSISPIFASSLLELGMASSVLRFVSGLAEIMQQTRIIDTSQEIHSMPSVNALLQEPEQTEMVRMQRVNINGTKVAMKVLLHKIKIPEYIISLRNRISHDITPSHSVLYQATNDSLLWIKEHWWDTMHKRIQEQERTCRTTWRAYKLDKASFSSFGNDIWLLSKIIGIDILNGELNVGNPAIEKLLKDEKLAFQPSNMSTMNEGKHLSLNHCTTSRLSLSATIASEILYHLLHKVLNRKQIEIFVRWFKFFLNKMEAPWKLQLSQHIHYEKNRAKEETFLRVCDLLIALLQVSIDSKDVSPTTTLSKEVSSEPSPSNPRKRRRLENPSNPRDDTSMSEDTNIPNVSDDTPERNGEVSMNDKHEEVEISRWEVVDSFNLPIGHVLPYSMHSSYTYNHFQFTASDIEMQFVDFGDE